MWFFLLILVLLTNGMGAFGLKVIAAWKLPSGVKIPYLAIWYAAGMATVGLPMLLNGFRMKRAELTWGGVMALLSIGGQLSMATALDMGVPGSIVFPVSAGGSLILVVVAGRVLFGERINLPSMLGVGVGLLAVVLLTLS
jgi:multidrug transporter EmrE-like cation transporter